MKSWKKDLDALVEQTMAFVKTVKTETARSETATAVFGEIPMAKAILAPILAQSPSPQAPVPKPLPAPSRPDWITSEREQITQRVATFKAHQEKLRLERDVFCNNALATIKERLNSPRV